MKITGQNVPPQLATKYKKLVATNATGPGDARMARTRRSVRATKPKAPAQRGVELFRSAAAFVADALIADGQKINRADFIGKEMRRLLAGEFDPAYWKRCDVVQDVALESLPTSVPREFIPSYIYPDETNQPTTPTYPDGMPANDMPSYEGALIGDRFEDQRIVWERVTFDIVNDANGPAATPLFLNITGSISINASHRTCKAFRAFVYRALLCGDSSAWLDDTTAPVSGVMSVWPKVKPGETAPPYYTASQDISHVVRVDALKKWREPLTCTRAVVHVAPRALMGKWYNNNTSVALRFAPMIELWRVFLPIWNVAEISQSLQYGVKAISCGGSAWVFDDIGYSVECADGREWGVPIAHENFNIYNGTASLLGRIFGVDEWLQCFSFDPKVGTLTYHNEANGQIVFQGPNAVYTLNLDMDWLNKTTDGATWTRIPHTWMPLHLGVFYVEGWFYCCDGSGNIYKSKNFIDWHFVFYNSAFWKLSGAGFFNGELYVWRFQTYSKIIYAINSQGVGRQIQVPNVPYFLDFLVMPDSLEMWYRGAALRYSTDGTTWKYDNEAPRPYIIAGVWQKGRAVYSLGAFNVASRKRRA